MIKITETEENKQHKNINMVGSVLPEEIVDSPERAIQTKAADTSFPVRAMDSLQSLNRL